MCMCSLERKIMLLPHSRILLEGFMQASIGFYLLGYFFVCFQLLG